MQLDVRSESPARRHELIVSTYQDLDPGNGFILINDHDPKPLYYQFAAEYPDEFTWDYLASGPEVWKVRIGRPKPSATMSELQPPVNLSTAAAELLDKARASKAGRAARTLTPGAGAALKQTLMALLGGQSLAPHDSPDAASLQVLSGTVVLTGNDDEGVELFVADHTPIPPVRHGLHALQDAVVMISVGQDVDPERLREHDEHKGT